jgi:hypothetical protein
MTDAPGWRAHVAAMIERARAGQDELFYRMALPQWEKELEAIDAEMAAQSCDRTPGGRDCGVGADEVLLRLF